MFGVWSNQKGVGVQKVQIMYKLSLFLMASINQFQHDTDLYIYEQYPADNLWTNKVGNRVKTFVRILLI